MESTIKVRISPKRISEIFEDTDHYAIRWYEFLGINEEKDFDAGKCTAVEWEALINTDCIYLVRLRHSGVGDCLPNKHIYSSWTLVEQALARHMKRHARKNH